ncbi:MAG: hypothetical protein DRJ62_04225 [Thermoprotei archaeon]|nr:MAG: hypothetical protein DRJ62_04225 [Thermoprotei archaeon]
MGVDEDLGSWVPRGVIEDLRLMLPLKPKYLDLGCGDGALTVKVAGIVDASEVHGVDDDPEALREASRRGLKVYNCDLNRDALPFSDGYFDLATAFEVVEHLENPSHMLREAFRVLRRGGVLVLETPNIAGCASRFLADQLKIALLFRCEVDSLIPPREGRGFNPQSLRLELRQCGFEVYRVLGVSHRPLDMPTPSLLVEEVREGSTSSAPHIVAIARRP